MPSPRKAPLRAVKPGEEPQEKRRLTITEAAGEGNHRDLLVALRERVARTVEDPNCPPRDLAALSRRLQEIAKEIDAIDARAEEEDGAGVSTPDEEWGTA